MLPFVIAGLTSGSVYALTAVGLVLTYKTSGIFNFAQGAIATIAAYLFYVLHVEHGMPWAPAAVLSVLVLGPVLGLVMERLAAALQDASLADRVASTIGILLVVQSGATLIFGSKVRNVAQYLPHATYHLGGTVVSTDQMIIFLVGLLATGALFAYFRVSRHGLAMRAVVDNADLLAISGADTSAVRRRAWMIGSVFACASGVLLVPLISVDPTILTFLIIAAFGAAALGGFTNLPLTYLGGLVIGVGAALCSYRFTSGLLSGLSAAFPFVVLFVVLLVSPRRRFTDRGQVRVAGRRWSAPWPLRAGGGLVLLVFLCLVPHLGFVGFHLVDWISFVSYAITFLSLGLLTRTAGQVSLCHVSFLAIGVAAFSHLNAGQHWPWFLALFAAGAIAVPIGAVLAIPASRLSGLHLALATFGFGVLLQYMFYTQDYMFGDLGLPLTINRPTVFGISTVSDKNYYYLVLGFAVLATAVVLAVDRSRLGRLLRALADSPVGLATGGAAVNVTRVLVFCISAFLAAISGVLQGGAATLASGDSYLPITSLVFFALILISVGGTPFYAAVAAAGFALVPSYLTSADVNRYLQLIFGAFAVLYAVTPEPRRGVPAGIRTILDRIPAPTPRRLHPSGVAAAPARERVRPGAVEVLGVQVRFGGLVAVDDVTLSAPTGRITALVGPNGAGKTTTFNAISGLVRPARGRVLFDDANLARHTASSRARLGIGRTFQKMELYDTLSVRDNVALGLEADLAGVWFWRHLSGSPRSARRVRAATDEALTECGLHDIAARQVGSLSTGQRRLVELARCLAGRARVMLLDEPSSGLDVAETEHFGATLLRAVASRGVGLLLVEHDMALVRQTCDYVYVLDFGAMIFEGTVAQALSSPVVQTAYLGRDELAEAARIDQATAAHGHVEPGPSGTPSPTPDVTAGRRF